MVSVGVVIPCYNESDTLERAVESAFGADIIMIVNDQSDEATYAVGRRLEKGYSDVFNLDPSHKCGVCAARNFGIDRFHVLNQIPELVIPLDADDYFLPGGLEALRDAYEPGTFVYSDYVTDAGYQNAPPPGMINRKNITHATICYSEKDWDRVGGYDPDFNLGCEDWALTCAFVQAGLRPKHIPVATYYRTENPNGRAARCLKYAPLLLGLLKDKYPQVFTS